MRIAFLAWHGSIHTRRWVQFFAERGHDVHVVTCGDGDIVDDAPEAASSDRAYRVHDVGRPRFGKLGYLLKRRSVRRCIRDIAPEIVHAHWLTSYGMLALSATPDDCPLVVTAHGDDLLIAPRRRIFRSIVTRVLRRAQLITVPSDAMRDAAYALVPSDELGQVVVFQYGVETARLHAIGVEARSRMVDESAGESAPLRLVSARALLDIYRIDVLLDAIALLHHDGVDLYCDLIGDGPCRAALERQAAELDIAHLVHFHGHLPGWEVERMVATADVYVSISESDGVSLAMLEALALGVVAVLSDIPANRPWIRDGVNGMLTAIAPGDVAQAIRRSCMIDREAAAATSYALVAERADRATNLAACELLVDSLTGVVFERNPAPVSSSHVDADAADGVDAA